ncbi:hypothetical protein GWI33_006491 [Rhynchophorus ferrugineus]|uniref:Uncharacterized protein n=1 Tax=Rhynchophorus ferrugineus TaxID=354439 RepID=A0A834MDQ9_RHYFE|nr:hypothetical protein GWI33_006491 [Rhynchophorus ferrugineus]
MTKRYRSNNNSNDRVETVERTINEYESTRNEKKKPLYPVTHRLTKAGGVSDGHGTVRTAYDRPTVAQDAAIKMHIAEE